MRWDEVGIQLKRNPIFRDSRIIVSLLLEHRSKTAVCIRVRGFKLHSLLKLFSGAGQISLR
jgi:hypothetical protein